MQTRGKFRCDSTKSYSWNKALQEFEFSAVCNDGTPENDRFHRYTPSGNVRIQVDNPNVVFEPGKFYYVDFTEVE